MITVTAPAVLDRGRLDTIYTTIDTGSMSLGFKIHWHRRVGKADIRFIVFVVGFVSGDELLSLVSAAAAGFSEEGCIAEGTRLPRLAAVSFAFFDCFSLSPCPSRSLCITSARALPIDVSPSVCRIDDLVVGRGRRTRPVVEVVTSAVVVAVVGDIVLWYRGYVYSKNAINDSGPCYGL